jgi:hypothetical protein
MGKNNINESSVIEILNKILFEETSKISRVEYNRIQFKIDDFENQLNESIKEFRKLDDLIPLGLKTITSGRLKSIMDNLNDVKTTLNVLKNKIKHHKKNMYLQNNKEN